MEMVNESGMPTTESLQRKCVNGVKYVMFVVTHIPRWHPKGKLGWGTPVPLGRYVVALMNTAGTWLFVVGPTPGLWKQHQPARGIPAFSPSLHGTASVHSLGWVVARRNIILIMFQHHVNNSYMHWNLQNKRKIKLEMFRNVNTNGRDRGCSGFV